MVCDWGESRIGGGVVVELVGMWRGGIANEIVVCLGGISGSC